MSNVERFSLNQPYLLVFNAPVTSWQIGDALGRLLQEARGPWRPSSAVRCACDTDQAREGE